MATTNQNTPARSLQPAHKPKSASTQVKKSAADAAHPTAVKKTAVERAASKAGYTSSSILAVVRIRGVTGVNPLRAHTLMLLGIHKSHYGTLVPAVPTYVGMLRQAKDYITWGPVSEKVLVAMLTKRGFVNGRKLRESKTPAEIATLAKELMAGKSFKELGIERTFRLTPPTGGFKDRKKNFPFGDLGPRPTMDDVLKNMI